jgi:uncharacterized protein YggE
MSPTRSLLARTTAIASVVVLGIVLLGPSSARAPHVAAQVLTTGNSGSATSSQGITVEGIGIVTVSPDEASVSLGVQTEAATASGAQSDASAAMTKIIAAVKAAGVADADLATQWVSLQPQIDYGPNGSGPSKVTGYQASQSLQVTVRHLDQTGAIIDAAVGAGANQVGGVSFSLADPSAVTTQARTAAMADAKARAQTLARAAGITLGAPLSITEVSAPSPVPFAAAAPAARAASTPIQAGTTQVEVDVQVIYAIGS